MQSFKFLLAMSIAVAMAMPQAQAHGDIHAQIEVVSQEIKKQPTAELYLKRGELHRVHSETQQALADYDQAEKLDPQMISVLLCRGRALFDASRPQEALPPLDRYLKQMPNHGEGVLTRARVLAALGKHKQATEDFTRSIELAKAPLPEQYLERSAAQLKAGDPKAALAGLEVGMARIGEILTLQVAAIEIEVGQKDFAPALARVDKLISAAQRKESWQAMRGDILVKAGRGDDARQAYQQALASIEALPGRLRAIKATQDLEKKVRSGITGK